MSLKKVFLTVIVLSACLFHAKAKTLLPVTAGSYVVDTILVSGNNATKSKIIFRELLFQSGDTLDIASIDNLMSKSQSNLMNTSLFNIVTVNYTNTYVNRINIHIHVIERWYTWPFPFFQVQERNFNTWWETRNLKRASYGCYVTRENFRGRMETLKVLLSFGYDEQYSVTYQKPYINKAQTIGLGISAGFKGNHEVAVNTINNKQVYFKYNDRYLKTEYFTTLELLARKNLYISHLWQLHYNRFNFADSVLQINPAFSYRQNTELQYFSIYYKLKIDHRDYKSYPLEGHYADVECFKFGLGILHKEILDLYYFRAAVRKFWQLSTRWYAASGFNMKYCSPNSDAYFLQKGLGFNNDFVRSYEHYVSNGRYYGIMKTCLKFELVPQQVVTVPFIPTEKFNTIPFAIYLNVFADGAYIRNSFASDIDLLANRLLFGSGVGIDYVTYYDKVMRLEFSVNRMGESGIFVHFTSAI